MGQVLARCDRPLVSFINRKPSAKESGDYTGSFCVSPDTAVR